MSEAKELACLLTSWGVIRMEFDHDGISRCTLPRLETIPREPFVVLQSGVDLWSVYVRSLFERDPLRLPAIGKLPGTPFQQQVWKALLQIPVGETRSYTEVAAAVGRDRAVRAVANACGRNPVPLFVPCHRVIRSDGEIGGFSSGTAWKRLLLAVEQQAR